jgi:hypothetical protein
MRPYFFFPPPAPLISVAKVEFVACTEDGCQDLFADGSGAADKKQKSFKKESQAWNSRDPLSGGDEVNVRASPDCAGERM